MPPKTSSRPTFEELVDEYEGRLPEMLHVHVRRMSERLPDWVLSDPVAMQRVYELSEESIADEIAAFRVGALPKECPDRDAQSAREVARLGQPIDMMLTGFRVGHRCQWEAWLKLVEERVEDPDHRRDLLERASRFLFEYVDRLSALVSEEHEQERERILRGAGQRRVQLVRELLDGAEVDSESLDWPLNHHHLGILAWAEGGDIGARQLAESLGRPLLIIEAGVEGTWFAWASASAPLSAAEEHKIAGFRPTQGRLATGLEAPGAAGFRLTHSQSRRAGWVAWYTDLPLTRFADVALEALAIEDAESARAFTAQELHGLNDESARSERLRETLGAYFEADHNAAAAAAALDIHQQTVANRIRTVEEILDATVASRRAELELALRLRRCFEKPPSLQAGLQNEGYLP
jgi:hypothetical protein